MRTFFAKFFYLIVLTVIVIGSYRPVWAHGSDYAVHLDHAPVGPYWLNVLALPEVMRVGETQFQFDIVDQQDLFVPGCTVAVEMIPLLQPEATFSTVADNVIGDDGPTHEATLSMSVPGPYRVLISVSDNSGAKYQASYELVVAGVPVWVEIFIYFQLFLAVGIGFWLTKEGLFMWRLSHPKRLSYN